MKKTMFITSVIMVIVMAIALTTSSLAWFTASGATTVYTSPMQVSAKADAASTGIAISLDGVSNWSSSVSLIGVPANDSLGNTTANTNLLPVLPFAKSTVDATIDQEDLTAALVGGTEDAYASSNMNIGTGSSTARKCYMIGNKIDTNKNFAAVATNLTREGYYTTQVFVANTGSGDTAQSVVITPTISFYLPDGTTAYTETNRNAAISGQYSLDATLCVAVLAKVGEFTTDSTDDDGWEIIGYADSKGGNVVRIGTTDAAFTEGKTSIPNNAAQGDDPCYVTLSISAFDSEANSEAIGPALNGAEYGQVKTIKIVAWYDATTLNNNNASKANLQFGVSFARTAVNS